MWRLRGAGGKAARWVRDHSTGAGQHSRQEMERRRDRPQGKEGTWETVGQIVRRTPQDFNHDWILGSKGPAGQYGSH